MSTSSIYYSTLHENTISNAVYKDQLVKQNTVLVTNQEETHQFMYYYWQLKVNQISLIVKN